MAKPDNLNLETPPLETPEEKEISERLKTMADDLDKKGGMALEKENPAEPEVLKSNIDFESDDLYKRLGVDKNASHEEIVLAFQMALEKVGEGADQELNQRNETLLYEAFNTLKNPESRIVFDVVSTVESRETNDETTSSVEVGRFKKFFRGPVAAGLVFLGVTSEAREAIFSGASGDSTEAPKKSGEYGMVALGVATLGFAIISKMLKGLWLFAKEAVAKKGNIGFGGGMAVAEKAFSDKKEKN